MAVITQGYVGTSTNADSSTPNMRQTRDAALVVQDSLPRYAEACGRAQIFTASTVNTGVSVASLTLTTTAPTAILNPVGSGKNIYLISLTMGYVSGTVGTGQFFLVAHTSATATTLTGTAATYKVNGLVGSSAAPVATVVYTATVPASGNVLQNLDIATPFLATTVAIPAQIRTDFDGSLGISPGAGISLQGITAAGSTPLLVFTWKWAEGPIV